jgi:hypothetical protein
MRDILDSLSDDMGHRAIAFDPADHPRKPSGHHRFAEGLLDLLPDHDICRAGFVLQRQEDDT